VPSIVASDFRRAKALPPAMTIDMQKFLSLIIVATICLAECSDRPRRSESPQGREHLQSLALNLEAGSVTRVEIIYTPSRVETPVALSPADLERAADYRLMLDSSASPRVVQSLAATLRNSRVYDSNPESDVRFGVVFYGSHSIRVGEIHLGGDCKKGDIDGAPVEYSGELCSWITHSLSGVL